MENTPEIEHIDMWHEQVSFLDEDHPFLSPAVFIEFNTLGIEDEGLLVQRLHTQIDFRLFYETFSDTCEGAEMQEEALSFLDLLTLLGMMLHGKSGKNFGTLRRTHVGRSYPGNPGTTCAPRPPPHAGGHPGGGAGNLYRISFECEIMDYTTMELASHADMKDREMKISNGDLPEKTEDEEPLYHL